VTLYLVRHGRPLVERDQPASAWSLDPAGYDDIWALRSQARLPHRAGWFCSPEPKAVETAQLLTDAPVGIVDDLREQVRESTDWIDDFSGTGRRAFAEPHLSAYPGWESLDRCRERVVAAVRPILAAHGDEDVVLIGHGTAWTLLAAELTGTSPDLKRWEALGFPDVIELGRPGSQGG